MEKVFQKMPLLLSIIFFILSCSIFLYLLKQTNSNYQKSFFSTELWQREALRREEIKALDRSVQAVEKERAQLKTHFARSSDIVPFLDTIEELGPKVGVKAEVTSVDVLKNYAGLLVGMKASGTFSGLYKFLTLLENSPYELEFISVDMSRETILEVENKNTTVPKWDLLLKIKLLSFTQ